MEISTFKEVNFKENSIVKVILRYEVLGKPKAKKDLILHFKVKRWKPMSVVSFVDDFVRSWLSSLLLIQSSDCRWTSIKFKVNSRSSYFSFPLGGLYGSCKGFELDINKAFKFLISCKSNLYHKKKK